MQYFLGISIIGIVGFIVTMAQNSLWINEAVGSSQLLDSISYTISRCLTMVVAKKYSGTVSKV
jgi:hypothetical protein